MTDSPPKRRRNRGAILLAVLALVLGLLVVAAVVIDGAARGAIREAVADRVRQVLELEPDHPIDVEIAGASVLWQAASGRFERVDVDAGEVAAGDLRGALAMTATGIPTDPSQPTERVDAEFRVEEADLAAIAGALSEATIEDVALEEGEVRFRSAIDLFGVPLEFGVGLVPGVIDGALAFTPTTLTLGDEQLELPEFLAQFGELGAGLVSPQRLCVAEYLPRDLVLEEVVVEDAALVIGLGADEAVLDGEGFTQRGSCP